ncbi:MAG TPA: glycosyltransferase family 2 protein [Dehalococcoidia bacterium]|nr:glycosyltransferase family 2 protein [Dehalococcoidia bacterium]
MTTLDTPTARVESLMGDFPFVSVLLAVRNEAGFIGDCLRALDAQDYPHNRFEVLLLDGESTDGTLDEAHAALEGSDLDVAIWMNYGRTTAAGFNLGLDEAAGEAQIIIKVDGHTQIAPDFISANVRALRETGADAAGGPIETRGRGVVGRAIALAMSSPFGVGDSAFRQGDTAAQWTDSVPYGAYRREVFERIGKFAMDIDRGEDDEFNYRLRQAGGRIWLTPEVRSVFYCRDSLPALARQYWNYGLAKAAVLERHPARLRPRHLVPSSLVITLAGGLLLSPFSRRFAWLTSLAGGVYAGANLLFSWRLAQDGHKEEAPYLPAAFACIHLSAGAGLIAGFVRQLRFKKR